ncbi:putative ribonuclease H-like domain-containing protein [Tanacetum coccineum]
MCDKKNSVLFNDTDCIVLSPNFKLIDESQVLLRVPRKNNMYSVDLKNIVPKGGLTCIFAKATSDESKVWYRRLCHLNFKTMNKLVKGNLVRGLSSKLFENDQTCVACQKGKQHRASFITDDYSRFTWVFFLATKDETSGTLKSFITGVENLIDQKVKVQQSNGFAVQKASDECTVKLERDITQVNESKKMIVNAKIKRRKIMLTALTMLILDNVNTVSSTVNAAGTNEVNAVGGKTSIELPVDPNMPALEDYSIF